MLAKFRSNSGKSSGNSKLMQVSLAGAGLLLSAGVVSFSCAAPVWAQYSQDDDYRSETRIKPKRLKRNGNSPIQGQVSVDRNLGLFSDEEAGKIRDSFSSPSSDLRSGNPVMGHPISDRQLKGSTFSELFNLQQQFPNKAQPLTGGLNGGQMKASAQKDDLDNAPYVWCQSVHGGYYDASGTCKEVIPGFRLKEFGGKFVDGTPVPRNNVQMNEAGHVWWRNDLSRNFRRRQ